MNGRNSCAAAHSGAAARRATWIVARIDEQLSAIDALRATIERARCRSASLRRAVLERAFRGELVPQDPTDEPASILLDRIRAERASRIGHWPSSHHRATMNAP